MDKISNIAKVSDAVFLQMCDSIYSDYQYHSYSGSPYEHIDFEITATTKTNRTVILNVETKLRNVNPKDFNSIYFEEYKYKNMLLHREEHYPTRKYYYVSIYPIFRTVIFFDIDKIKENNLQPHTKRGELNNVTNIKVDKQIYEIPYELCYIKEY